MSPRAVRPLDPRLIPLSTQRETRAVSASPQLMLNEFDVSLRTGLAVATLRRWRWQRKGPAWKKLGTAVRYDPRAVEAWLVSRDVEQDHADDR